jgi:membrane protein YqaA with SNARE-associated domain
VPGHIRWIVFGTALALAGAAAIVGGVVGFLFGIPLSNKQRSATDSQSQYEANTNLEQVSDWLTKIIVGVGLVQIGRALPALSRLAKSLKTPLGGQPSSSAFGLGLAVFYVLLGFLFLYLWSRQVLPNQLQDAVQKAVQEQMPTIVQKAVEEQVPTVVQSAVEEKVPTVVQKELGKSTSAESNALDLVNRQLNSAKGGEPPTQDELNEAVASASGPTRFEIFGLAERARVLNRQLDISAARNNPLVANQFALVKATIPVFRALIAADTGSRYHRNYGALGWALADQDLPENIERQTWQEASDELTTAIEIRDRLGITGWRLYEANRARCDVHLLNDPQPGDPPAAELMTRVEQDLIAARDDPYAAKMLDDQHGDQELVRWIAAHPLPPVGV